MTRRLLAAAFFLLFAIRAASQSYQPGLLVRSNGDTLRGEIENNFWVDPPTFIHFRPTPAAKAELLRPRQLRAVLFDGGRYFRFEALPIDHAAETRLDRLPQGFHPDVRIDSLLAEVLLEGPASLLRVVRIGATHYLVRRTGQPVLDLSERRYLAPGGKLAIIDGNNYQAQLELYFGDCPVASQAAREALFTPEGLVAVLQAYNATCSPTQLPARSWLVQAKLPRSLLWRVGVLAGARYLKADDTSPPLPKQLHPVGGLYAELFLPNRSLAFYGELSLSGFRGTFNKAGSYVQTTTVVNGGTTVTSTPVITAFSYRAFLSSGRLGFRYFYPLPREQQWLLGGGLEVSYVLGVNGIELQAGPATGVSRDDITTSLVAPFYYVGTGWRNQRITVSADAWFLQGVILLRPAVSYCLSRKPAPAKPPG